MCFRREWIKKEGKKILDSLGALLQLRQLLAVYKSRTLPSVGTMLRKLKRGIRIVQNANLFLSVCNGAPEPSTKFPGFACVYNL